MASGGLGRFGTSLIALPLNIATTIKDSLTSAELAQLTGSCNRLPNSITGLKPSNPALPVINSAPITVPYHSIIGYRGKQDHSRTALMVSSLTRALTSLARNPK